MTKEEKMQAYLDTQVCYHEQMCDDGPLVNAIKKAFLAGYDAREREICNHKYPDGTSAVACIQSLEHCTICGANLD